MERGASRGGSGHGDVSSSGAGAVDCNMAGSSAVIAGLASLGLESQCWTIGLDVAYATARIALFGSNAARTRASRRLMANLSAVIA